VRAKLWPAQQAKPSGSGPAALERCRCPIFKGIGRRCADQETVGGPLVDELLNNLPATAARRSLELAPLLLDRLSASRDAEI
jgi:hypothetical protein